MAITKKDIKETLEDLHTKLDNIKFEIADLEGERDNLIDTMGEYEDEESRDKIENDANNIIDKMSVLILYSDRIKQVIDALEDVDSLDYFD